jgi:hypothetical protein
MAVGVSAVLQAKIFQLLTSNAPVSDLVGGRIYDNVPDSPTYPYIHIGEDDLSDWGAHDVDGFECEITIHTWSQAKGKKESKTIQDRIYELLHNGNLGIQGQKTIVLRQSFQNTMLDPDGATYHGINRFKLILGGF